MKWRLSIVTEKGKDSIFRVLVCCGDYEPNTPYFRGGGKNISNGGTISTTYSIRNHTSYPVLHLRDSSHHKELLLLVMDTNVLHFVDGYYKLIKGDESFGFALNRIN